ncbi:hypothetical protein AAFF_G00063510, partial [Aldrovandia affinis]
MLRWCADSWAVGRLCLLQAMPSLEPAVGPSGWMMWGAQAASPHSHNAHTVGLGHMTVVTMKMLVWFAQRCWGSCAFGRGEGSVGSKELQCRGNESQIYFCPTSPTQKQNCSHENDVGLVCSGSGYVRLKDGGSPCAGRVEDAEVVCRVLGCGAPAEVRGAAAFGRGEGSVGSKELQCRGNESQISFCPTSPTQKQNCSHENDVGLVCSGSGYVRLKDGGSPCAGRVEVNHGGEWRRVCGAGWGESQAQVVCRELGCGTAVQATGYRYSGSKSRRDRVFCTGSESTLEHCRSEAYDCNRYGYDDAGVICSGGVRLVGGAHLCDGRVEVHD